MVCFNDYSDAAQRAKTMRVNGITKFILHVAQCINFCQENIVTTTLIAKESLKSFYSRLGFKFFFDLATSTHFEEACKQFNYESVNLMHCRKIIGLQCHQTFPLRVTILHDNRIGFNENRKKFKDLNEDPP